MRIWCLILLGGCRGFFNVPAVGADGSATVDADLGPPITFVQPASNAAINSMNVSGYFALDEVAGDTNVAIVEWSGAAITGFSDSSGNSWTSAVGPLTSPSGDSMQMFVAIDVKAGHDRVDVAFSTSITSQIDVLEYANVAAVDQATGHTGMSTDAATTGAVTTTASREVLVVADELPPGPAMYDAHVPGGLSNDWVGELVALRGNH